MSTHASPHIAPHRSCQRHSFPTRMGSAHIANPALLLRTATRRAVRPSAVHGDLSLEPTRAPSELRLRAPFVTRIARSDLQCQTRTCPEHQEQCSDRDGDLVPQPICATRAAALVRALARARLRAGGVALFDASMHKPIATDCVLALDARVRVHVVPIVARLTQHRRDHAVPTVRQTRAGGRARTPWYHHPHVNTRLYIPSYATAVLVLARCTTSVPGVPHMMREYLAQHVAQGRVAAVEITLFPAVDVHHAVAARPFALAGAVAFAAWNGCPPIALLVPERDHVSVAHRASATRVVRSRDKLRARSHSESAAQRHLSEVVDSIPSRGTRYVSAGHRVSTA
eukprot:1920178-Rhodomonas_salina.5